MLAEIDKARLRISAKTEAKKKSRLGQFLTPASTARFMANLFDKNTFPACHLLDPGAGIGSLSGALLEKWAAGKFDFTSLELTACEIDPELREALSGTLSTYQGKAPFSFR